MGDSLVQTCWYAPPRPPPPQRSAFRRIELVTEYRRVIAVTDIIPWATLLTL